MKDVFKFITRLDNIVLLFCLVLMGAAVCHAGGPEPKIFVGTNELTDSSVTTAKIADDAVTAAKILETIDLPVNSISATSALNSSGSAAIDGFIRLGDAATGIKMKILTGLTSSSETGNTQINTGVDYDKIVGFRTIVATTSVTIGSDSGMAAYQFQSYITSGNKLVVENVTGTTVLNATFTCLLWYKE